MGANTHVLIHHDGDALLPDERKWLIDKHCRTFPVRTKLFITELSDVEHYFCRPDYISEVYGLPIEESELIVSKVLHANNAKLTIAFANKRREAKEKLIRDYVGARSADEIVGNEIDFKYAKGKTLLGKLMATLQEAGQNSARLTTTSTESLVVEELTEFAKVAWSTVSSGDRE